MANTADSKSETARLSLRSSDFRYIPCDAINLGLSDNGVKLLLGVEEMDGTVLDFVGVHMTHRTAAILKMAISQAFDHYEEQTGEKIPVPDTNSPSDQS